VQQVCYELLTRPQRQKLHFSAAEWYQAADASSGTQFRLIAHHWGRAKVVEKQVEFLAKAGEAAIRDGAFREAATGFTEILEVSRAQYGDAPPPEEATRRAHWEHQLGQAYFGLGDLPQATEHLRKSLELRGWPFRASTKGRIADTLVQFFRQLTHRVRPGWHLADRVDPELREVAATYLRLGRISYYNSDILAGTNAVLRALNVAEMIGPSRELAVAYASVTVLTGMLRWQRAARVYAPLTESIARQVCGMQDRSLVFAYLCMWNLGQGRWDRVDTLAREALELAERISDHAQRSEVATILAMMNCFRANYAEAAHWTATMFDGAKRSGNTMHAAWATNILGECDIRQGRSADAVVKMQESAAALHGNKDRTEEIRIHGMLAGLAVRSGDLAEAARHADVAEAVATEATGITCSTLEGFAGIVETRVTQAERDPKNPAARKAVKAALASLKKYAKTYPIGRPRLALYEGRMCLLDGSIAKALKIWRSGQTLASTLRLPFDEALLHEILMHHTPPNAPERQGHREAAARLYEQVGAVVELQRLRDSAP
jgi:tetratricopeptide (TPR) repeat protein